MGNVALLRGQRLGVRVFRWITLHRQVGFPPNYKSDNPIIFLPLSEHYGWDHTDRLARFMGCGLLGEGEDLTLVGREASAATIQEELQHCRIDTSAAERAFTAEWKAPRSLKAQTELEQALATMHGVTHVRNKVAVTPVAKGNQR